MMWYYLVSRPVTTYSHSQLAAFENQSDTTEQPITLSSFLGTVFHLNLRDFYRKVQQGEILTAQQLEQQFERLWHDTWVNETQWKPEQMNDAGSGGPLSSARWGYSRRETTTDDINPSTSARS